jgi:hypothetical protein
VTITFDERRWCWFVLFVLCTAFGLWAALTSFEPPMVSRAWVGGLFCGFGLSSWCAFLIHAPSTRASKQSTKEK